MNSLINGHDLLSKDIPEEVKSFIERIIPHVFQKGKYVHENRILIDYEYVIPNDILKKDPFFAQFRDSKNKSNVDNYISELECKLKSIPSIPQKSCCIIL
jgi:hypothetical protein